jgi:hypothetical protein
MIAAHEAGDLTPGVGAVHDHFAYAVSYDLKSLWEGQPPTIAARIHTPEQVQQQVARAIAGEYVDCHVWLFTPDEFLTDLHELRVTGRSQWLVEKLVPTPANDLEFRVVLRRVPRGAVSTEDDPDELLSTAERPDWIEQQLLGAQVEGLVEHVVQLEAKVTRLQGRVQRLRGLAQRRAERVAKLRARVQKLRRAAAAPPPPLPRRAVRAVTRRLRGRPQ